jgi:hypothetical protein
MKVEPHANIGGISAGEIAARELWEKTGLVLSDEQVKILQSNVDWWVGHENTKSSNPKVEQVPVCWDVDCKGCGQRNCPYPAADAPQPPVRCEVIRANDSENKQCTLNQGHVGRHDWFSGVHATDIRPQPNENFCRNDECDGTCTFAAEEQQKSGLFEEVITMLQDHCATDQSEYAAKVRDRFTKYVRAHLQSPKYDAEEHKRILQSPLYEQLGNWDFIFDLLYEQRITPGKAIEALAELSLGLKPALPEKSAVERTTPILEFRDYPRTENELFVAFGICDAHQEEARVLSRTNSCVLCPSGSAFNKCPQCDCIMWKVRKSAVSNFEFCPNCSSEKDDKIVLNAALAKSPLDRFSAFLDGAEANNKEIAELIAHARQAKMSQDEQVEYMVRRFLMWRLPENFTPDAGISFKPTFNDHLPEPMKHNPVGTNLFDYTQAKAMVQYMLEGMSTPEPQQEQNQCGAKFAYETCHLPKGHKGWHNSATPTQTQDSLLCKCGHTTTRTLSPRCWSCWQPLPWEQATSRAEIIKELERYRALHETSECVCKEEVLSALTVAAHRLRHPEQYDQITGLPKSFAKK